MLNQAPPTSLVDADQMKLLINTVPQLLWIATSEGEVIYYNHRLEDYTPDALITGELNWAKLLHSDDLEPTLAAWTDAVASCAVYHHQHRLKMRNGEYRWHLSRAIPYLKGDEPLWYGSATDIHDNQVLVSVQEQQQEKLQLAQKELEYQKELLETVTQNTTLGLLLMDSRQHCIYMNEAAEAMTGYKLSELQGRQLHYYIHHRKPDGSFYPLEECPIDRALPQQKREQGEEVFVHRDGHLYPVAFTASPIVIGGVPLGTVIEVRETSEERKRSEALRKSEESLSILVSTLPQLVWMIDREKDQGFLSEQWFTYTGESDITTENWSRIVHPDDFAQLMDTWRRCDLKGITYKAEARIRNREGEYHWHFVHGEPIRNAEGSVIKWIGAFTNIHAQKTITEKLEWMVENRTRQLTESQRILEQRNEELTHANKELESMNYIASHDLQEPLRKIQTFASILLTQKPSEQRCREYVEKMQQSARRMSELIHDVMEYKKLTYSEYNLGSVDLNEVLVAVMEDLELMIEESGALITADPLPVIRAIPLQMHQLFSNLLANAIKFRKETPEIHISTESMKGNELPFFAGRDESWRYTVIKVRDNGVGFEPEHAERIFTLFQRLHNKNEFAGTGMGLAICKRILENHLGHIYASGIKGKGAVFTVVIPY